MNIQNDHSTRFFPGPASGFLTPSFSETEFLRIQFAAIEAYLEHFPSEEREFRALAWIEANARQYRQQWQTQATTSGRHLQSTIGR